MKVPGTGRLERTTVAFILTASGLLLLGPRWVGDASAMLLLASAGTHLLAALAFARLSNRKQFGEDQRVPRMMLAGLGLLTLSLLARAWFWTPASQEPRLVIPTVSELFAVSGLLAILGSLAWLRLQRTRRFGRIRILLDYSLLVIGVGSLTWLVLLEPPIMLGIADFSSTLWLGLAPMLDFILLALLIQLWLTGLLGGDQIRNLGLLSWLLLRLGGDLGYGFSLIQEQIEPVSGPAIGWTLSATALWSAVRLKPLRSEGELPEGSRRPNFANRVGRQMPVIVVYLVAGFALLDRWASGAFDPYAVITGGLLLVLLLARQGVISGQAEMMQYASLVNSAAEMAFVIDQDGGFILTNPSFQQATGAQPEIGSRSSIWEVVVDHEQVREGLERAGRDGWTGELQFLTLDDAPFPVQLSLAAVFDERRGEVVMAGTGHDLTEIKNREQQLRDALTDVDRTRAELAELNVALEIKVSERTSELEQLVSHLETLNEELKQLDQLKSEFVTLVSHELRSPLTNIRSGLELTLRRERKALTKGGTESLDLVLQETERLTSFVETILDLSTLEAGRFPMKVRPVDARIMIPLVRNRFPSRQAGRISFNPPDPAPLVLADEPSLASVLFHLLDNALKYSPGEIEIRVAERGDRVVISVLDSGPGIPPQSRESIFDRFHRLDSSDSREIYGHGLGLYLCRRLTEAMGGTVALSEDHSPGARFEVNLPAANEVGPAISEVRQGRGRSTQEP